MKVAKHPSARHRKTAPEHSRPETSPDRRALIIALILAGVVLLTYGQTLRCDFINYDDDAYVSNNAHVRPGLTFDGIVWAFTSSSLYYWHPLTWLSHMLDCQLFELKAGGHHAVNVLLHAGNALLVFVLLFRLTGALWRSATVAALFALHPIQVESVAWIAERKNVLSGLMSLLTLLAYAGYCRRPDWRRYLLVVAAFAAALMSKPAVVPLPFALLLLDYWPLGRLDSRASALRAAREKLPLFVMSLASSLVTFKGQQAMQAMRDLADVPLAARLANAAISYMAYLRSLVWPGHFAILYPYQRDLPLWAGLAAAAAVLAVTAIAVWAARRAPFFTVGWLWYLVMLLPAIGIVQVGDQARADRFVYLPVIGILVALTWGAAHLTAGRTKAVPVAAGVLLVVLAARSWAQTAYWRDSLTLFTQNLQVTPDNAVAHNNLGDALVKAGRTEEALAHFREGHRIAPECYVCLRNLGTAHLSLHHYDEARASLDEAVLIRPHDPEVHYRRGLLFLITGRREEAIAEYREALRWHLPRPFSTWSHNEIGMHLAEQGRNDEARAEFSSSVEEDPKFVPARKNLALVLAQAGRTAEAVSHYRMVLALEPNDRDVQHNLAVLLSKPLR